MPRPSIAAPNSEADISGAVSCPVAASAPAADDFALALDAQAVLASLPTLKQLAGQPAAQQAARQQASDTPAMKPAVRVPRRVGAADAAAAHSSKEAPPAAAPRTARTRTKH